MPAYAELMASQEGAVNQCDKCGAEFQSAQELQSHKINAHAAK